MSYTREEVLAMPAGRELDALVQKAIDPDEVNYWQRPDGDVKCCDIEGNEILWRPSSDIVAAYEVIEEFPLVMIERVEIFIGNITHNVTMYADVGKNNGETVSARTLPEAVCKAALLSLLKEG